MFNKILKNQHGISLLETMMAAAISIGIAMGVMQINQNASKGMSRIEAKAELLDIKADLQRQLSLSTGGTTSCGGILSTAFGASLENDGAAVVLNTAGDQFNIGGGGSALTVGSNIPGAPAITVVAMRWGPFVPYAGSSQGQCDLELELQNNRDSQVGTFFKKIPISCSVTDPIADPVNVESCTVSQDSDSNSGLGKMVDDLNSRPVMVFDEAPQMVIGQSPPVVLEDVQAALTIGSTAADHADVAIGGGLSLAIDLENNGAVSWGSGEGNDPVGIWGHDGAGTTVPTFNIRADITSISGSLDVDGTITNGTSGAADKIAITDTDGVVLSAGTTAATQIELNGKTVVDGNFDVIAPNITRLDFTYTQGINNWADYQGYGAIRATGLLDIGGVADFGSNVNVTGNVSAAAFFYTSDERYKEEIETLSGVSEKLDELRGVSYYLRSDEFPERNFSDQKQIGLIAQEVEKVFPELVHTGEDGYKSVAYANFVAILIEAVKDQKAQIIKTRKLYEFLESRIDKKEHEQDARIVALERENQALKQQMQEINNKLNKLLLSAKED